MAKLLTPDQTMFESEYCGRCGGSGSYSWNAMHGDRCYGCNGQGVQLTKRGAAAMKFYHESQQVPVSQLVVGSYIWQDGKWREVLELRQSGEGDSYLLLSNGDRRYYFYITTKRGQLGVFPDSTIRAVRSDEERKAQVKAAQEYQATLTKMGKPMKRIKAAA
jgi:hypothetical protein